jgi:hypothetical protein
MPKQETRRFYMNRAVLHITVSLFLLGLAVSPGTAAHPGPQRLLNIHQQLDAPGERIYFYSAAGDEEQLIVLREHLIAQGARKVNGFLPFMVVCELPNHIRYEAQIQNSDIIVLQDADIDEGATPSHIFSPHWVKLNYRISMEKPVNEMEDARYASMLEKFTVPAQKPFRRPFKPFTVSAQETEERQIFQNSEFMVGDILALLIFPESQGPDENWSDAMLSQAGGACVQAMLYYQEAYPRSQIDFNFKSITRALTTTEPINFENNEEAVWITDVMNQLGYEGDQSQYLDLVHQFNNEWRENYGADWVFTAFIVNSTNDPDHRFGRRPAKFFRLGFGHLGGPLMTIPFPTGMSGITPLKQVFIYELGHIFWAQYESLGSSESSCNSRAGYLNERNWNRVEGIGPMGGREGCSPTQSPQTCIMNIEDVFFYYDGPPCAFTDKMLGLSDVNNNRVPDAVDAAPIIEFEKTALETVVTDEFDIRFHAISSAVTNRNSKQPVEQRVSYALPIKDVNYWINGAGPLSLVPDDGVFDEDTEDFTAHIDELIPGFTEVEVVSRNSMGASSQDNNIIYRKRIFYIGLNFHQFFFFIVNNETTQGIGISWNMIGNTFDSSFDLHRYEASSASGDSIIASSIQPSGPPSGEFTPYYAFDGNVIPGRKYRYFVTGTFSEFYNGKDTTFTYRSIDFEKIAALPVSEQDIISAPSPNPFKEKTRISIIIPPSYTEAGTQSPVTGEYPGRISNAPALRGDAPTKVNIVVYNALGQRVRSLFSGWKYATTYTEEWDGLTNNNVRAPSGVYFIRVTAGPFTQVQKVILVR